MKEKIRKINSLTSLFCADYGMLGRVCITVAPKKESGGRFSRRKT